MFNNWDEAMPQQIEHIDAIARRVQRDVLFVVFHTTRKIMSEDRFDQFDLDTQYDWISSVTRRKLIAWLGENGIGWESCGNFANTNMMVTYCGQIYIDLPYNPDSTKYRELEQYLEKADGSMRYSNATFCTLDLKTAMKNAEHDKPGFWESWAENF